METHSHSPSSHTDSGYSSSPRSRDQTTHYYCEDPPRPLIKVKLMCSYGGKIAPRPHDHQLVYVGGHTKILTVDRNIKFSAFVDKLSSLCCFNDDLLLLLYQLPGEDLDNLISVTNDEDLEHMMIERDRLISPNPFKRLRLFLFFPSLKKPVVVLQDQVQQVAEETVVVVDQDSPSFVISPDHQPQISSQEQANDFDNNIHRRAFPGDLYVHHHHHHQKKIHVDNTESPSAAAALTVPTSNYWHGSAAAVNASEQPVYLIGTPAAVTSQVMNQLVYGYQQHPMQQMSNVYRMGQVVQPPPEMIGRYGEGYPPVTYYTVAPPGGGVVGGGSGASYQVAAPLN